VNGGLRLGRNQDVAEIFRSGCYVGRRPGGIRRNRRRTTPSSGASVFIYAGLGERERALQYQEKAYEDGASPFNYLTPCIRALYALSAQHKKRLEQMRLIL